jgi:hypothetical protein
MLAGVPFGSQYAGCGEPLALGDVPGFQETAAASNTC